MSLCVSRLESVESRGVLVLLPLCLHGGPCIGILIGLEVELHIGLFLLGVDEVSELAELNDDEETEEERPEEGLNAVDEQLEAPVHKPE